MKNVGDFCDQMKIMLLNKKENRFSTIHRGVYKRKLDPNSHKSCCYASLRLSDVILIMRSILYLILP